MILTGILTECATPNVDNNERFVTKVKPTLESYCIECHTDRLRSKFGGFSLETADSAMNTGRHKPVIIAGNPDASLLYHVLRFGHESPLAMPPAPDGISDRQLDAIRDWIAAGAHWPAGRAGHLSLPR
jgi:mono/diheme cytochrome c family protein